ncbi:MAG: hypothetical protein ACI9MC_003065 [Kiritimatiellia bacterium]
MRICLPLLLGACTSAPEPEPEPASLPLSHFSADPHITVLPNVALIPANGLEFVVEVDVPVVLEGHAFTIVRIDGDQAIELPEALPEWTWDGAIRRATLRPKGLKKGAPYGIVSLHMASNTGPLSDFIHRFRVLGDDTTAPDGANLRVQGDPAPTTQNELRLAFNEPVHHSTVHKLSALCGGQLWDGSWTIQDGQRVAVFTPTRAWGECMVTVFVNAGIRDLGGNELVNRPEGHLVPMVPIKKTER